MKNRNTMIMLSAVFLVGNVGAQITGVPIPQANNDFFQGAPASSSPGQKFRYYSVKAYLRYSSPLKFGDQVLAGMGDEAAADLSLILNTRPPLSVAEMQTALDIVHNAFMHPRAIQNPPDRKPTAALAFLKALETTATDQLLKERIVAERTFLNTVPQTFPPQTLSGDLGVPSPRNPLGLPPQK